MEKTKKHNLGLNPGLRQIWFIIASLSLTGMFFSYYGDNNDLVLKFGLSFGSIFFILSLMTYEYKVHISMVYLFISYLFKDISQGFDNFSLSLETILSLVAVLSSLYLVIRDINKKSKRKLDDTGSGKVAKPSITFKEVITNEFSPMKIANITRLIMILLIVTVIFQLTNSYNLNSMQGAVDNIGAKTPWIAVAYTILPLITILLSIVPIYDVVALRLIHNLIWIYIIQLAISIGMASQISLLEPLIYIVTILVSSKTLNIRVRSTKNIDKNTEEIRNDT